LKRRDGGPMYRPRYPGLVRERVRWVGDCVAFVVADSGEILERTITEMND
jgi:carbon-monoxide dehydrogenase large subunit